MRYPFSFCWVLLGLGLLCGSVGATTVVPPETDRFWIDPDSLTAIRTRAGVESYPSENTSAGNWPAFDYIRDYVDARPAGPAVFDECSLWAFMYKLTGTASYGQKAVDKMMTRIPPTGSCPTGYCVGTGGEFGRVSTFALVRDWCEPLMSEAEKAAVDAAMSASYLDDPAPSYTYQFREDAFSWKVATYGRSGIPFDVVSGFNSSVTSAEDVVCPCFDAYQPGGGEYFGYAGLRSSMRIHMLETLKMFGLDLTTSDNVALTGEFFAFSMRPDGYWLNWTGKTNPSMVYPLPVLAWYGSRTASRLARAALEAEIASDDFTWSDVGLKGAMYVCLWRDSSKGMTDLSASDAPKFNVDEVGGRLFGRTGWDVNSTSTDVLAMLFCGPFEDGASAQGSWSAQYGDDEQILKSEWYALDFDHHYTPWIHGPRGRAGMLTIKDPAAGSPGTYTVDPTGAAPQYQAPLPNVGKGTGEDLAEAEAAWPECDPSPGVLTRSGRFTRVDTGEDYADVTLDLTDKFTANGATSVYARWTWLFPGYFLHQYSIELTAARDLAISIPFPRMPSTTAVPTVVAGQLDVTADGVDQEGGIFDSAWNGASPIANVVTQTNGAGMAVVYPMERTASTGTPSPKVRIVGGPDANGRRWRQDDEPTNSGYTAGSHSWEAWLEESGVNHLPGVFTAADTAAAARLGAEAGHLTAVLGDGRAELTMLSANGTVHLAYLVHVTAAGTEELACRYTETDGILAAMIEGESEWTGIACAQPSASVAALTTMTWDNPGASVNAVSAWSALGLTPLAAYTISGDGTALEGVTADANGCVEFSRNLFGVGSISIAPPAAVPGLEYIINDSPASLPYPNARHLLIAGDGTWVSVHAFDLAGDVYVFGSRSTDSGRTWYQLDTDALGASLLLQGGEASQVGGQSLYPRSDLGFGVALDASLGDLIILSPYERRLDATGVVQATQARAYRFYRSGALWATTAGEAAYSGTEYSGTTTPTHAVLIAAQSGRVYGAWKQRSGSSYLIRSMVMHKRASTASLAATTAVSSSLQYVQLVEAPRGTINRVHLKRTGASADSVIVANATDGSSPVWGNRYAIPEDFTGAATVGEWAATGAGSTVHIVVKSTATVTFRHIYGSGASWTVASLDPLTLLTSNDRTALTPTRDGRVVLTQHFVAPGSDGRVESSYLEGGVWSAVETVWTGADVDWPHCAAIDGERLALMAISDGSPDYLRVTTFSIPPALPTAVVSRRRRVMLAAGE